MTGVLLASGGLDSTLVAAMHDPDAPDWPNIHLFVDYGQCHRDQEHRASTAVAKHYGAEHVCFSLPLSRFGGSSLTGGPGSLIGAETVVPGRNTALISVAISLAVARGAGIVFIGCNASDSEIYPDCRPEFLKCADEVANLGYGIRVRAPLRDMSKTDIGRALYMGKAPVELTWSCYAGGAKPCGACGSCQTRKEALDVFDHA